MKKINGKITFLFNRDGALLELRDSDAGVTFVRVELDATQVMNMLSRMAYTPVLSMEVQDLEKLGKKLVVSTGEFEMPSCEYGEREAVARKLAAEMFNKDGWESDGYFGSQNSFFQSDGKSMARVSLRKWVDI